MVIEAISAKNINSKKTIKIIAILIRLKTIPIDKLDF